ncbi:MAG: hypothetical protein HYS24_09830 [Ignavibacteriales bacterium]|nr:hypothetical protein [Ignavibacteriales bacterium]
MNFKNILTISINSLPKNIYVYKQNKWVNDNYGFNCGYSKIEVLFIKICRGYYNLEYLVKYEQYNTMQLS